MLHAAEAVYFIIKWKRGVISFKIKRVERRFFTQTSAKSHSMDSNGLQVIQESIESNKRALNNNGIKKYFLDETVSINDENKATNTKTVDSLEDDASLNDNNNTMESIKSNHINDGTKNEIHENEINVSKNVPVKEQEQLESSLNASFIKKANNSVKFDLHTESSNSNDSESESDFDEHSSNELRNWKNSVKSLQNSKKLNDYVLARKRESFNTLSELKIYLFNSPANSDLEKAWSVFLWICNNIQYDIEGYVNGGMGNQNSNTVFKTGLSISTGFANLSKELFDYFTIKSVIIEGYSKSNVFEYEIGKKFNKVNHDWNAIFIDGKWGIIECTWGSGSFNPITLNYVQQFEPHYFLIPPEYCIYQNFPVKSENQFLNEKLNLDDFEAKANFNIGFFLNGFKCKSHLHSLIAPDSNQFQMEFEAPHDAKLTGYMKSSHNKKIKNAVFIQKHYKTQDITVDVSIQSNDVVRLCLFGSKFGSNRNCTTFEFNVKPLNFKPNQTYTYCSAYEFPMPIFLFETKEKYLKLGSNYSFKLYVCALQVSLINAKNQWKYFEKSRNEKNIWTIEYEPDCEGELNLSAKISEDNPLNVAYTYFVII